jgi:hypothetical protein
LNEAVEHALAQPDQSPPAGVSASDWERVLQARRGEAEIERLRRLGPQLQPGESVAVTSDVGVRRPEKRRWLEIRTACVRTATGYRYLSGSAQAVLQQLHLLLLLCGGLTAKLTLLGDGARWIATFFKTPIACWPGSELIMDWYHAGQEMLRTDQLDCTREGGEEGVAGPTPLPPLARPTR